MVTWPSWLPYPINWVRALGNLMCWSFLTAETVDEVVKNRSYGVDTCWIDETGATDCLSNAGLGSFLVFIFFVQLVFQAILVSVAHHWFARLRGKSRGWFPRWASWREGVNGSIGIFCSGVVVLIGVILVILLFPRWLVLRMPLLHAAWIGGLIVNACLHQYDHRVRQRRAENKKRGKRSNFSPNAPLPSNLTPPPVDPIEQELNKLRADMGLNQMRRRQKPPGNSQ